MAADQVGVTGNAFYRGVTAASVAFGTPGNQVPGSASGSTLSIFTEINKTPMADTAETRDNDNEVVAKARTNKRMQLRFSAKPFGAARSNALAIAAALPLKDDVVVITCAGDSQVAGTAYVDDSSARYSPEGELIVDLTVTKYANTFIVLS
jgi:hypothetical protein